MRELTLSSREFGGLAEEILAAGETLRFRARGTSMLPTIRDGDLVEVRPIGKRAIRRGDVVLLSCGARVFVHRVVRVVQWERSVAYETKGDALGCSDGVVHEHRVLGRAVATTREGRRINLSGVSGRAVGLLLPSVRHLLQRLRCLLLFDRSVVGP